MKNRGMWVLILLMLIVILLLCLPRKTGASVNSTDWVRSDGSICSAIITEYGVALDCDCPCLSNCEETQLTLIPTDKPQPTDKPDPTPKPTKKPECNSGRGNGSEGDPDCDPGNSGKKNKGGD